MDKVIILIEPKTPENIGSILRSMGCFEIDKLYLVGEKTKIFSKTITKKIKTDVHSDYKRKQIKIVNSINDIPEIKKYPLYSVELIEEKSVSLFEFKHPKNACYVFGAEDGDVPNEILNQSKAILYIPTYLCLNLAQTVNILLYDIKQKLK